MPGHSLFDSWFDDLESCVDVLLLVPVEIGARHYFPSVYQRTVPGANHPTHFAVGSSPTLILAGRSPAVQNSRHWSAFLTESTSGLPSRRRFQLAPSKAAGGVMLPCLVTRSHLAFTYRTQRLCPAFLSEQLGRNWRVFNLGVPDTESIRWYCRMKNTTRLFSRTL
jgi:hypothetical protein